ncbi:MAG: hypothetical protein IJO32_02700 [Bacilli bacterium]|nr:hypothetical protein [Bacilli bacterium]
MNTEKVFIAFSKTGEELLLYKKNRYTYINLLSVNNDIYPIDNIDSKIVIPYKKAIKSFKYLSKQKILDKYTSDRYKLIDPKNIKLGTICEAYNIKKVNVGYKCNYKYDYDSRIISNTLLLKKNNKYINVLNNKKYYAEDDKNIKYIIDKNNKFVSIKEDNLFSTNEYVQKKDVMELVYKIR